MAEVKEHRFFRIPLTSEREFLRRQKMFNFGSLRCNQSSGPPLHVILPGVFDRTGGWCALVFYPVFLPDFLFLRFQRICYRCCADREDFASYFNIHHEFNLLPFMEDGV